MYIALRNKYNESLRDYIENKQEVSYDDINDTNCTPKKEIGDRELIIKLYGIDFYNKLQQV